MFDGDWRSKLALGIAVALYGVWIAAALLSGYQRDHGGTYERAAEYEYGVPAISAAVPTPPRNPNPDRDEWREESDLQAQWKAADWTLWGAVVSGFGTLVALLGVFFVRETLRHTADATKAASEAAKAASRSADIAERQLTEADSGRIYVEALTGLSFDDSTREPDKQMAGLTFLLRNVGPRWVTVRYAKVEFLEVPEGKTAETEPTKPVRFRRATGVPSILEPLLLKPEGEEQVDAWSRPLDGEDWRSWGLFIQGIVIYTNHLNINRHCGFCFRWIPTDEDDGLISYVWSYDERVGQNPK